MVLEMRLSSVLLLFTSTRFMQRSVGVLAYLLRWWGVICGDQKLDKVYRAVAYNVKEWRFIRNSPPFVPGKQRRRWTDQVSVVCSGLHSYLSLTSTMKERETDKVCFNLNIIISVCQEKYGGGGKFLAVGRN